MPPKRQPMFQPQTLDIDETILDRNLRIVGDVAEDGQSLLGGASSSAPLASVGAALRERQRSILPEPDLPSIEVTPEPGICVKTKNLKGTKVFINLCRVNEIPPAPPMSEARLSAIVADEDYSSDYRVPMSLGAPREERDKSGGACLACDVAVNSAWFGDTVAVSDVFAAFVVHVAMEGLCEKFGDDVNLDRQNWTVLKNKKYLGTPQRHRIQQRAKGNRIQEVDSPSAAQRGDSGPKPLIQEVKQSTPLSTTSKQSSSISADKKPSSVVPSPSDASSWRQSPRETKPAFKIFKEPRDSDTPNCLVATIELPGVRSARELTLDVGDDRLVLEARKAGYLLDIFLPYSLESDSATAQFHRDKQILSVKMPVAQDMNTKLT